MMLQMELFESFSCNVCIDLGGRYVSMAQQHLHDPQVGSMIEQMCRKGMAQYVRAQALRVDAGF